MRIIIPNFVENDLVMILGDKRIRFGRRLLMFFAVAMLGLAVACTRDLPDPERFVKVENGGGDQPGQPATPGQPENPTQPTDSPTDQPTDPPADQPTDPSDDQPVEIKDTNLRAWVMWYFDSDKDGILTATEAEAITRIELNTKDIATLDGIGSFPNLSYLHAQGVREDEKNLGGLTELDLSSNPKLTHIHLIYNNLKTLKLGDLPHLDYLGLDYNELTELDVRAFKSLTLLQVSYNKLKAIDVSGLDDLDEFHCADNPIETITLSNAKLRSFRCSGTLIKELDLSKCPKMNDIDCTGCPNLTKIKLAKGQVIGNIRKDDDVKIEYYE